MSSTEKYSAAAPPPSYNQAMAPNGAQWNPAAAAPNGTQWNQMAAPNGAQWNQMAAPNGAQWNPTAAPNGAQWNPAAAPNGAQWNPAAAAPDVSAGPQVAVVMNPAMAHHGNIVYVSPQEIPANEVPDNFVLAILVTIFCCWPLGLVAIGKANACKIQRQHGNRELAIRHSQEAKRYSLLAIGIGILAFIAIGVITYIRLQPYL